MLKIAESRYATEYNHGIAPVRYLLILSIKNVRYWYERDENPTKSFHIKLCVVPSL